MRNGRSSFHFIVAIRSPIRLCPIANTKTLSLRVPGIGNFRQSTFANSNLFRQRLEARDDLSKTLETNTQQLDFLQRVLC